MKTCPECNRTFEDTFTFCLVDGAVLSAPVDVDATRRFPVNRNIEPPQQETRYPTGNSAIPTQLLGDERGNGTLRETVQGPQSVPNAPRETVMYREPEPASRENLPAQDPMKTMVAPPPEPFKSDNRGASQMVESASYGSTAKPRSNIGLWVAAFAVCFVGIAALGVGVWMMWRAKKPATSAEVSQPGNQSEKTPSSTSQSFTDKINGAEIQMIYVPGGTFQMGSPVSEAGRDKDEGPQGTVTVQNLDFGKFEVTQAQYKAVMNANPSTNKGDNLPVDSVSWNDSQEFCRKLSELSGHSYRLPTEAEWEFAARAGTSGPYSGDINSMAWFESNSGNKTHSVGQKQANSFGLYDMYGNVWEWTQSKYKPYPYDAADGRENIKDTDVRVMRGGSMQVAGIYCRSAYRRRVIPDTRSIGFRVVSEVR